MRDAVLPAPGLVICARMEAGLRRSAMPSRFAAPPLPRSRKRWQVAAPLALEHLPAATGAARQQERGREQQRRA